MKTAFVTGGTGFIGGRLISLLVAGGVVVRALGRSQAGQEKVKALGAIPVPGDVTNPKSMKEAMRGCDVVFHVAAMYEVGARYTRQMEAVNVQGARNVFQAAVEAGVSKIVYTSTAAVHGDTKGRMVDETHQIPFEALKSGTLYEQTKWRAHHEVALPMIREGAPIVILESGGVYGPEDHSVVGDLLELYARGRLPVLPDRDTAFTMSYVDDIAEGHILAAARGRIGESYCMGYQPMTLGQFADEWAKVSGRPKVAVKIPSALVRPSWPLMA
ncbi:MAG TPA: NAD-dependent epimerase/dehydratase family protein, partial [Anaerolineales bacterium]|nr:NAD-dependent epimerase/dehydratase family protein [Anaerolineales bacterium]